MPYLLEKSRFGINFFVKRNTILLLYMYQVFIFLQDHLHFFLHFFFTFMEQLFWMTLYHFYTECSGGGLAVVVAVVIAVVHSGMKLYEIYVFISKTKSAFP